jgi:phage-related protein
MRQVIFYKTARGESPVEDFLYSLTVKQQKKIAWVIGAVRDLPFVHRDYFKKLTGTDNIWEVRIDSGSDTFRLLGFMDKGHLVILTNGFVKKTERTPPTEIRLAETRKKDYESRRRDG